ncbi:MAG TPA: UDP-N-acetylmuramoyl-L-alanine--D-glutamate ligase, partial [Nitrospiria bacterium]|nr:UDP-N-acetylmuramoyl-L-alanine--D-glutamate ligase [Nitrospiria bacterium]
MVGYGKSGQSAVRLLLREEAVVTVTDRRKEEEIGAAAESAGSPFKAYYGGHPEGAFRSAELIVVSPGVRVGDIPELEAAAARGVPVIGEVELAYGFLDSPIIAVTGSNGKSTTT